jgi:hypothetical protein
MSVPLWFLRNTIPPKRRPHQSFFWAVLPKIKFEHTDDVIRLEIVSPDCAGPLAYRTLTPIRPRDPSLSGEPGAAKLFGLLDVSNGIEQAPEWGGDQIDDG